MTSAASSAISEREERVFTAALGLMDSSQEGEAVAAFLRVRGILRGRGSGFRRLLERCQEAERLNDELGRQNAELLRENAALRARDSRPIAAPAASASRAFSMRDAPGFRLWDVGFMFIIAVWAAFGLLGTTMAFTLSAAVLICAAFANWFSPFRFILGALLAFAAYATATTAPALPTRLSATAYGVAEAPQPSPMAAPTAFGPASPGRGDIIWRRNSWWGDSW
jgi:hypothetical protein